MSRKRPSVPKVTVARADRTDAVDVIAQPVAGQTYDDERGWLPTDQTAVDVPAVDDPPPAPLGWVPAPPDTDTPIFNQVNVDRRWERLLAASRADTAAMRTHLLVTMSGRP